ncbi:aminotransferase class V-fold PLP-dependent enzyme [Allonocardiopsis opalescens]|uniref:L-seryl-tRNA(Ser) seleniumtransferase n=1 Tax=Allonocardiopsis opalescens TaxID=1144618 RepID=A0A2T0QAD4_9ACTN|nr:aminotransferase class V-fold PLP-dependent enzyme [Allonocardiopsis opalescens]PRY00814.1 L-seryl-tRNA(Ser) seleniumtransferase [Allonocardiopsis opalescens]
MGFHTALGLTRVINASTTFTALGGSLMPPEVLDAMREAAGAFVDMHELHAAAGRRLAELTRNEAAYATSGCAAALVLGVLAARTGGDPRLIGRISEGAAGEPDIPDEVVMHAAHRIPYDPAVTLAGARVRQIGNVLQTFDWELEAALTERTAAVLYVAGSHLPPGALPLDQVVRAAHERGVPVIVDAAAQLPPVSNLWHFTAEAGADLAVFSGGKALRGPQASGLMVGRADLVEAARLNGAPYQRLARAMKAGKEEIAGLLAAVQRYVELDHDALARDWEATVAHWLAELSDLPGVTATRDPLNEAGQPVPRVHLRVDATPDRVAAAITALRKDDPAVAVLPDAPLGAARGLWLGPDQLQPGEAEIVTAQVRRHLGGLAAD